MCDQEEARRLANIRRRKTLPVGTEGRVCGHNFTVTERAKRACPGGWRARVRLDNGKPDTAMFTDDHVTRIPGRPTQF